MSTLQEEKSRMECESSANIFWLRTLSFLSFLWAIYHHHPYPIQDISSPSTTTLLRGFPTTWRIELGPLKVVRMLVLTDESLPAKSAQHLPEGRDTETEITTKYGCRPPPLPPTSRNLYTFRKSTIPAVPMTRFPRRALCCPFDTPPVLPWYPLV